MGKAPSRAPGKANSFCGSCGTALRDGARFCPACGTAAHADPPAPSQAATGPPQRTLVGLGFVALVVITAVAVWQLSGDDPADSADPGSVSPSGESPSLIELQPEDAAEAVDCSTPCTVTGVVAFLHPSWGPSSLVTVDHTGGDYGIRVVDAEGDVVWSHEVGGAWTDLTPNDPGVDETGHLFVNFNPGRYNGVIVLEPVEDGFEDFETLPDYGDYATRFYYAEAVDVDGDGTLEVQVSENDCDPSCAGGSITSVVYTWDDEDYR